MLIEQLKHLRWLLVLLALQVLVFGQIHIMGYATPLIYVSFAASMQRGTARAEALLWCFLMGLSVDLFTMTPGLAAASMTLVGMIQPVLLETMLPKEVTDDCKPSFKTLGYWRHMQYLAILITIHHLALFAIEACTLAHWTDSIIRLLTSILLTFVLILPVEKLRG